MIYEETRDSEGFSLKFLGHGWMHEKVRRGRSQQCVYAVSQHSHFVDENRGK